MKLTASPSTLYAYQSSTQKLETTITLTSPVGANIANIQVNSATTAALKQAIGNNLTPVLSGSGNSFKVELPITYIAKLKAGSSYTLVLDVTPEGMATNLKPSQVRVTVKVLK